MLVLSRKVGEKLSIGDDIEITFLSQRKNRIRLGINAPKDITVHRNEVFKKIADKKLFEKAKTDEYFA